MQTLFITSAQGKSTEFSLESDGSEVRVSVAEERRAVRKRERSDFSRGKGKTELDTTCTKAGAVYTTVSTGNRHTWE